MLTLIDRVASKARRIVQPNVRCFLAAEPLIRGKAGLEIGGPSDTFNWEKMPLYRSIRRLDNCNFSAQNAWTHQANGIERPKGNDFIADGSGLTSVPDDTYDFVLSCHNLEHLANPVKALKEWQRVTRPGGALILVVPNYRYTFDHRRTPTKVEHMLRDYDLGTPESDMTHLEEILKKHDLSLDPGAGSFEAFRERSRKNFENRCLHHHVFNKSNMRRLLKRLRMKVLVVESAWRPHIFAVALKPH